MPRRLWNRVLVGWVFSARRLLLPLMLCLGSHLHAQPAGTPRLALVIGNAAYRGGTLLTSANDAGLVAQTLAQIGFEVTAAADADATTVRKTLAAFRDAVRDAGDRAVVFVYLSGYGLQYAGANVFVPIDARIDRQSDVPLATVPLAEIQQAVETLPARGRIFVYDLAYDHPFAQQDALPLAKGLGLAQAPPGSLYALNAAPDRVARPDPPFYGTYARALAEMLREPGLTPRELFKRVRLRVAERSGGDTVPWDDSALDTGLTLLAGDSAAARSESTAAAGATPPEEQAYWTAIGEDRLGAYQAFVRAFPAGRLAAQVKAMADVRLEAAIWADSVRVDTPSAYWSYMGLYKQGPHYVDVRRRLAQLHAPLEPPSRYEPYAFADLPRPSQDQIDDADGTAAPSAGSDSPVAPRLPDAILGAPRPATDYELAPPPAVPIGVLPVAVPLPAVAVEAWPKKPGRVRQPFVPGLGAVVFETTAEPGGTVTTMTSDAGLVTRTVSESAAGRHSIVQTDAADEIVSRTTVTTTDGLVTTMEQEGPDGEVSARIVTRIDPLGARLTTMTDGEDRLVAKSRADRRGVVHEVTRGDGNIAPVQFALPSIVEPPTVQTPAVAPIGDAPALTATGLPVTGALARPDMPQMEDAPGSRPNVASGAAPSNAAGVAVPRKNAPGTEVPRTEAPKTEAPKTEVHKTETPKPAPQAAQRDGMDAVPLPVPRPARATQKARRSAASGKGRR